MHAKSIGWNAHRNTSVKPRGSRPQNNNGSEVDIIIGGKTHHQDGNIRPGTAPKQAMMNNFARGGHGDRPISPYSKVYGIQGQNHLSYQ